MSQEDDGDVVRGPSSKARDEGMGGIALAATMAATRGDPPPTQVGPGALADPVAPTDPAAGAGSPRTRPGSLTLSAKAVLPRPRASPARLEGIEGKPRYVATELLGEGGMGEVVLAEDHDIDRRVAIKRLRPDLERTDLAVLRFADEVRTIGALQHPNIVPVYDAGMDSGGQPYFVMKFLEGETMESVIRELRAGDPAYREKYTYAYRCSICVEVLRALEYAHKRGVLHRDLKPANVMIGPHGEVTLTDWGIAKKITPRPEREIVCGPGRPEAPELPIGPQHMIGGLLGLLRLPKGGVDAPRIPGAPPPTREVPALTLPETEGLARTRVGTAEDPLVTPEGALLGTPLYMSPEQAAGKNEELDERSDLYSASVMFGEFLSLRHYLEDRKGLLSVIDGVLHEDFYFRYAIQAAHTGMPNELFHVFLHGMFREPDRRWQSAKEMALAFERTLSGDIWVCCPFTLTRRVAFLLTSWVNEHPRTVTAMVFALPLSLLSLLIFLLAR